MEIFEAKTLRRFDSGSNWISMIRGRVSYYIIMFILYRITFILHIKTLDLQIKMGGHTWSCPSKTMDLEIKKGWIHHFCGLFKNRT